ncbi:PucR family transcriptional regulator [Sporosarcina sp. FSL K6-1508]|uniref:PucR family transcriptional regulator n=1 Tax=Sporosarcina sp. FSL K6-1508 TaxID=2921553 RepID=UPI0030F7CCB1
MIGVGTYQEDPQKIHISFEEAKRAVHLGRTIYKEDETVFYEQLRIFKLLETVNKNEAEYFLDMYLGKIMEYDDRNNSNLWGSLVSIVENDWNLKLASAQLYIHYNTMKYRFQKISEVLQLDFKKSENKLSVMIALHIQKLLE